MDHGGHGGGEGAGRRALGAGQPHEGDLHVQVPVAVAQHHFAVAQGMDTEDAGAVAHAVARWLALRIDAAERAQVLDAEGRHHAVAQAHQKVDPARRAAHAAQVQRHGAAAVVRQLQLVAVVEIGGLEAVLQGAACGNRGEDDLCHGAEGDEKRGRSCSHHRPQGRPLVRAPSTLHQRLSPTLMRALGTSPNISGAYSASTRVGGSAKSPALFSRTVYSTRVLPLGRYW